MNHAKLSLFGANILSSYSVEIDDLDGNTIATFKQGDSAGDFATEVLKHDGVGLGIYYKDSDGVMVVSTSLRPMMAQAGRRKFVLITTAKVCAL